MQKFLRTKYALAPSLKIDILHMGDVLSEGYSLMDVAYIYAWKRESPLRLAFRVYSQPTKRPAPANRVEGRVDVDGAHSGGNSVGQPQQCPPEQATVPCRPVPESSAVASVAEGIAQSGESPETDAEPPALVPRDVLSAEEAADAAVPTAVPAAEKRQPDSLDGTTATERSAAPGSAQAADVVRSSSPSQQQRRKAAESPAESPPALSKITISTLDRSSNKITIQTKEVPPAVAQAMSPPRSPLSRKSRRKEQRDAERPLQHARHQGRPQDSQGAQRPRRPQSRSLERPDGATPAKNARLNGADVADVEPADGRRASRPASPGRLIPERTLLPEPAKKSQSPARKCSRPGSPGLPASPPRAHPQTSRTPPAVPLAPSAKKGDEDTRPLDLSVSQRGLPAPAPVRRPVGRPTLALPPMCTSGTAKRPASPSPHRRAAASSPAVSLYQKPAVAVNQAATSSGLSQQHHHHHNHHRSGSRGFLKGANLTCINPDPDAFHPRIVIKNLPPRASGASFHRM
ncbi:proline-rich basic protein 1-like [Ixodes scapularis]|uniref:proline-rich basic protein 1-like n=1 Tax=Ixodes scapularis TaxID=6945 RepID=UPI001C38A251|nr:proline-rich basic protein 1-like [Ixodes scapularis]